MKHLKYVLPAVVLGFVLFAIAAGTDTPAASPTTAPATQPTTQPVEAGEKGAAAALIDKLILGGWTVGVQLIISVAGLAFAVERMINLRRSHIVPNGLAEKADALWEKGDFEGIHKLCQRRPSTLARMIEEVVGHRASAQNAGTVAADVGAREMKMHLQRAYPIAVVATLEPLLGLFGTVWGMIGAFDKVAMMGEMGNASALSNEISLALVTTAVGLAIAIPMLALYHYFKSRTQMHAIALEERVSHLISRRLMNRQEAAIHAA